MLVNKNLSILIIVGTFILGLIFRVMFPSNFSVGFDQVQIIENAKNIINGNLTLIGPRTGPANMFTGPLIYYISVPVVYFFGDFFPIVIVPALVSSVTGVSIYWIMKKYRNSKEAIISLLIWSFSPFLITLDRIFWNPNLTLLSSFFVFIPIIKDSNNRLSLFLLFLGSFLSFQSHFSGIILVCLALVTLVLKKSIKKALFVLAGFLFSVIPTIIFDIRNNYLNIKGFLNLLNNNGEFNLFNIIQNIYKNVFIITETLGKIFLYGNSTELLIALGSAIIILSLIISKKQKDIRLSLIWLISISIIFSLYSGEKPEYYFLITIPPLFVLLSRLIASTSKDLQKFIFLIFISTSLLINFKITSSNDGINILNIKKSFNYLSDKKVRNIVYDIPAGSEIGIKYYLDKIDFSNTGNVYHIGYLSAISFNEVESISNLGIWKDLRKDGYNYIVKDDYFLEFGEDLFILEDLSNNQLFNETEIYKLIKNNEIIGTIFVTNEKYLVNWIDECLDQKTNKDFEWRMMNNNEFIKYFGGHCVLLKQNDEINIDLSKINIW